MVAAWGRFAPDLQAAKRHGAVEVAEAARAVGIEDSCRPVRYGRIAPPSGEVGEDHNGPTHARRRDLGPFGRAGLGIGGTDRVGGAVKGLLGQDGLEPKQYQAAKGSEQSSQMTRLVAWCQAARVPSLSDCESGVMLEAASEL